MVGNLANCPHLTPPAAEIVSQTVTDQASALLWLKTTFMYRRMLQNPQYYGLSGVDEGVFNGETHQRLVAWSKFHTH